ncbi:MAG TPA: WYL domain-containing protein [Nocardioides sp.]|uniref:helix-turn-helix transcriptional regulator n=1 Tax=Nocardioides sp. TaxID=35761 RepID=UPI002EDA5BBB
MPASPKYVARIVRLLDVFEQLKAHPHGVPLRRLAEECGIPADELREDLLAYYTADPGDWLLGLTRRHVLEWSSSDTDPEDIDPRDAAVVRLIDEPSDLGVEYLSADELALVYTAAVAALDLAGPDGDDPLEEAIDVIVDTMFGSGGPAGPPGWRPPYLVDLQRASTERRKVRIVYSRQWEAGVFEKVVEPWRLVQTSVRGWEIDAGPVGDNGTLRSYLLSNVRSVEVLDETFEPPGDADRLLAAQRRTTSVRMELPHQARWSLDEYAESSAVIADADETFIADLELLEPVGWRVGLLMLAGGDGTRVLSPAGLVSEGPALARRLLDHHRS